MPQMEPVSEIRIRATADVAQATNDIKKLASALKSLATAKEKLGDATEFTINKNFTFRNPFRIIYEDATKAYAAAKKANKEVSRAMSLVPVNAEARSLTPLNALVQSEGSGVKGPAIDLDALINASERARGEGEKLNTVYATLRARLEAIKQSSIGQQLSKELSIAKSGFTKVTEGVKQFFASIKRIAMYRLIRSIIKQITQGFMEAYHAMYRWSQAGNDNNQFAESMDKIATALHYIHASLSALASPIINALAPTIDWLADRFVGLLNIINQVIATINNQSGWTRAIKKQITYGDTLSDTNKKAKELKKTLLGIDEINLLNGQNGSGTADNSNLYDYEWVEFGKDNAIHNFFKDWDLADILLSFGELLLLIEGVKLALKGLPAVAGVALGAAAALEFIEAFKKVLSGEALDWLDFAKTLIAAGGVVAAGALIGKAFGGALLGTAIGLVIGGVALAFLGIVDMFQNGVNMINSMLVGIGSVMAGVGVALLLGVSAWFGGILGFLVGTIVIVIATLIDKWDYVTEYWKSWWDGLDRLVKGFGNLCIDVFEKVTNFFIDGWNKALDVFNKIFHKNWHLPEIKFNRLSEDTIESAWNTYLSPETQGKLYYIYDKVGKDVDWSKVEPYLREAITTGQQPWVKPEDKEEVNKMFEILAKSNEDSTEATSGLTSALGGASTSIDNMMSGLKLGDLSSSLQNYSTSLDSWFSNADLKSISTDIQNLTTEASNFGADGTIAVDLEAILEKVDSIINNQLNGNNRQGDVYLDGDKVGKVMSKKSTIEKKSLDLYNQVGALTY